MASLPVIGDPKTRNDTFIEQLAAGARAAIERLDPKRVGMAGHSYGGFSTTNLRANSDLYRRRHCPERGGQPERVRPPVAAMSDP